MCPTILEMTCSNERMAGLGEKAVYAPRPVLVSSVSNPPNRTYSSMNLSYLQQKPAPPRRSESGTSLNSACTPFRRVATCNAISCHRAFRSLGQRPIGFEVLPKPPAFQTMRIANCRASGCWQGGCGFVRGDYIGLDSQTPPRRDTDGTAQAKGAVCGPEGNPNESAAGGPFTSSQIE